MNRWNRRAVVRTGSLFTLAGLLPAGARASGQDYPFTETGVCTSLAKADDISGAGGHYIEESVQRFLIPDRPDSEWEKKRIAARSAALPVPACNSFLPGSLPSTGPDAKPDAVLSYAENAFRRGQSVGVKIIVFGSSGSRKLRDGFPKEKAEAQFVELLKKMGPLTRQYDMTVALEPLRRQECNFINTISEGAAIVEQVGHPNIRLVCDWYHMMQNGEDPKSILNVGPLIAHTHIAEKQNRTAPGMMGDDFRPFFRAYREIGYTGRISIEGKWTASDLPRAFEIMRRQATNT